MNKGCLELAISKIVHYEEAGNMVTAFHQKAAALRQCAEDPTTDLGIVRFMLETAADMEAVAEQEYLRDRESVGYPTNPQILAASGQGPSIPVPDDGGKPIGACTDTHSLQQAQRLPDRCTSVTSGRTDGD